MENPPQPRLVVPLCALATAGFLAATGYWLLLGYDLLVIINAFWSALFVVITFLVQRIQNLETRIEKSFAGRIYHRARPAFFCLGPMIGFGYAIAATFWWYRHAYFWVVVNAAWALCFAIAGILIGLRGLRCALTIILLSAGGLYLVMATWWFQEGSEMLARHDMRFFCFNLFWCAVLVAAGLIVDRSRRAALMAGQPATEEPAPHGTSNR